MNLQAAISDLKIKLGMFSMIDGNSPGQMVSLMSSLNLEIQLPRQ